MSDVPAAHEREKNGKTHVYWQLVRSVRHGRKVVQETVAQLGELDAEGRARAQVLARSITGGAAAARSELFVQAADDAVDAVPVKVGEGAPGALARFGAVWLGWLLWRALKLDELCGSCAGGARERALGAMARDPGDRAAVRALQRIARGRALVPHHGAGGSAAGCRPSRSTTSGCTARWIGCCRTRRRSSSTCEQRFGELFDLDYDLLLYDVTSTYFEGQCAEQQPGPARLQARSPARLQAGEHRAGGDARGDAAGLRGLRRQHAPT